MNNNMTNEMQQAMNVARRYAICNVGSITAYNGITNLLRDIPSNLITREQHDTLIAAQKVITEIGKVSNEWGAATYMNELLEEPKK